MVASTYPAPYPLTANEMSNSDMPEKTKAYKPKKRRKWTQERRKAQSARIKKQKPWLKATGPKTKEGKKHSANNSLKHGFRSQEYKDLLRLLKIQKDFIDNLAAGKNSDQYEINELDSMIKRP